MYSDIIDMVAAFNAEKLTDKEVSCEDARELFAETLKFIVRLQSCVWK